jgi:hypothetical protein
MNKTPTETPTPQLSKKQFFEKMTDKYKKENPKMNATQIQAKVEGAWKQYKK